MSVTSAEPDAAGARAGVVPAGAVYARTSFAQQRLWIMDRMLTGSSFYNVPLALRLRGELDVEALRRALDGLVERHEALRTTFAILEGEPVQVVHLPVPVPLPVEAVVPEPGECVDDALRRRGQAEAQQPMDLESGPLLRARLLRGGPSDHLLMITLHHIVTDGWSTDILLRELVQLYAGDGDALPELPLQYADFAEWQREWLQGAELDRQVAYWRERLHDLPPTLELPADRPRPAAQTFLGGRIIPALPPDVAEAVRDMAAKEQATPYIAWLALFGALLCRYTGQTDLAMGSPIANRTRAELEPVVGFFVNTLVMRLKVDPDASFRLLLRQARAVAMEAYAHQDLPFEKLVEELHPERLLSHAPLFQVNLAYRSRLGPLPRFPGLEMEMLHFDRGIAKFDLLLDFVEDRNGVHAMLEYSTELFDRNRIERLWDHLLTLARAALADPDRPVRRLPLLTGEERAALERWNQTERLLPEGCFHEWFDVVAAQWPDLPAVRQGDRMLTYGELRVASDRLAAALVAAGAAADRPVGLFAERSPEMVIGLLGILKAGGAYLPLDPSQPTERLEYLLADSETGLLVVMRSLVGRLPQSSARTVLLEGACSSPTPAAGLPSVDPRNLAYILYTSGSTGHPKGVMVEHRGLANYLAWAAREYGCREGARAPVHSPLGFDLTVTSLLLPLSTGGCAELLPPDAGVGALADALRSRGDATLVKLTPAHLEWLKSDLGPEAAAGRASAFVIGGEALFAEAIRFWREADPGLRLINEYGPTETVVGCCVHEVGPEDPETGPVPIGRPIANTRLYVLDPWGEQAPTGVPGELYIGGIGVARGYLNRAELTAERFLPDPFAPEPGHRMFRTGDRVVRRADGSLVYLGRFDEQIKLRGFRIEPGEVETALREHPDVEDCVVTAPVLGDGDRRLTAYAVPSRAALERARARGGDGAVVEQWREVFDESYRRPAEAFDPELNLAGWTSSYTGEPIPAQEMREWVDRTVDRIRDCRPRRVLEIGCGTGLLLLRLARDCDHYAGTDFSRAALDGLSRAVRGTGLANVTLHHAAAHEAGGLPAGSFDTVVLNSVVQYFPGPEYLLDVLEIAARRVADGGRIFVGDVRSLELLEAFHLSAALYVADDRLRLDELRRLVIARIAAEEELVLSPRFFRRLPARLRRIRAARVLPKDGRFQNELNRFRYDVILEIGEGTVRIAPQTWNGPADDAGLAAAARAASERPVLVRGIRNPLTSADVAAAEGLRRLPADATAADLRALASRSGAGIHPGDAASRLCGIAAEARLSPENPGSYDLVLAADAALVTQAADEPFLGDGRRCEDANEPALPRAAPLLEPELRKRLSRRLPEYMIPTAYVFLSALPLTGNGKVDRDALPLPAVRRRDSDEYLPPEGEVEVAVAQIWAQLLRVERVGATDHFFGLGGHSLLAAIAIHRIEHELGAKLQLRTLFERPRLREFAAEVGRARAEQSGEVDAILAELAALPAEEAEALLAGLHAPGGSV